VALPALRTSPVIDGYGYQERDGEGDDVWEVSGDGVRSMVRFWKGMVLSSRAVVT
jgi:hypothetical protein